MASSHTVAFRVNCSVHNQRQSTLKSPNVTMAASISSAVKMLQKSLEKIPDYMRINNIVSKTLKKSTATVLDALVDSVFEFVDDPLLESQSNFAPVDEVAEPVVVTGVQGNIPDNFPPGVYIRNGANPLFGGLKSTKSVFGKSNPYWVEGEGMLHALYFKKEAGNNNWTIYYNNRYVETDTYKLEKQRNEPSLIPIVQGDVPAIVTACLINLLRFGKVIKNYSNTNVFEHSGKCYSVSEVNVPQEFDVSTLETLGDWDLISHAWNRRGFVSHPKTAPGTGELVIIGIEPFKPYLELGVISADGKRLVHRADLKLGRCSFCHDFGVTQRYNIILDFPLTLDPMRLLRGGQLIQFNKEEHAGIGVMPRYGDADSIKWFEVTPNCTFHIINCFEDGNDEVVVWACRALESIIPGPSQDNFENLIRDGLLDDRPYEWRLNMRTGEVKERDLASETQPSMDFPIINANFIGIKNRFGYTHVVHTTASIAANYLPKFGGLAKLHFQELDEKSSLGIKVEYHKFEENVFCTGSTFVPKQDCLEEDDGWIVTFVHNEDTKISEVYIIDTKMFADKPVAQITLPCRVPYGFHGIFLQT